MKRIVLLLFFASMMGSVGCSGQKIVEPSRDDFIDGEVETTIGPNKGPSDEEDSKYVK